MLKINKMPMEIHIKEKQKLHLVEANTERINKEQNVSQESKRNITESQYLIQSSKSRKSKRSFTNSNHFFKSKTSSIKLASVTGVKSVTDQLEGGEEVQRASGIAYMTTQTATSSLSKGASHIKNTTLIVKKRRLKKVAASKRLAKKQIRKITTVTSKRQLKVPASETTKVKTRISEQLIGTVSRSSGTRIDGSSRLTTKATRKVVGAKQNHMKMTSANRNRAFKYFLSKLNGDEKQNDSIVKIAKDIFTNQAKLLLQKAIMPILGALVGLFLLIAVACIPVVAVVAVLYNSPFAMFLPPLEEGDTVMSVAKEYEADFNQNINQLEAEHSGCDKVDIVYVDYEGSVAIPSNVYDVIAIYMVKYGVGDTATVMNDLSKSRLKEVFDDMCSYTTSVETITKEMDDDTTTTEKILHVNVKLKTYRDMISVYSFTDDEVDMLVEIMSPENMEMLGYSDDTGDVGNSGVVISELSESEIADILQEITNQKIKQTLTYALAKVGYPYSQTYRDNGNYYDCSSLAYYSWKAAGVNIGFGGATTAAAEGQGLAEAGKTVQYENIQPGDLIFYSYCNNGRYKNISHVAIYVGDGKVVEAANERIGVVYREVRSLSSIVLIGRP